MIDGKRFLGVIPARGGSKGVPRKNLRDVGGRPLVAWTIEAARGSAYLDRIVLSSDDPEIIAVAQNIGCDVPFVREARLADDSTPTIDVVLDVLDKCVGYEWVVLLQPTSPLRTAQDIDGTIARCLGRGAPSCVSVSLAAESPYWMFTVSADGAMTRLLPAPVTTRRQDLPRVYSLNGAVYVAGSDWLKQNRKFVNSETVAYVMPTERSLDIDTETDLIQLNIFLKDQGYASLSSTP